MQRIRTDAETTRLEAEDLYKSFGATTAVDGVGFEVRDGEILALLGPSGCGKTTTLRLVAGFERADAGQIRIAGTRVEGADAHVAPEKRRVGLVFQDYALFPHLDVAGNVGFGLDRSRRRNGRVGEMLELVGLEGLGSRYPRELSGGQQQRVALARALAPEPDVLLLDEPFSNLDQTMRQRVRADVETILRDAGVTAIFVTHSQDEALSMADTVCVMRDGQIVQSAAPEELYLHPATPFVAEFIADATIVSGIRTDFGVDCRFASLAYDGPIPEGESVWVAIRPESVRLERDDKGGWIIQDREYYGHDEVVTLVQLEGSGSALRCRLDAGHILANGATVEPHIKITTGDVFAANGDRQRRIGESLATSDKH